MSKHQSETEDAEVNTAFFNSTWLTRPEAEAVGPEIVQGCCFLAFT